MPAIESLSIDFAPVVTAVVALLLAVGALRMAEAHARRRARVRTQVLLRRHESRHFKV